MYIWTPEESGTVLIDGNNLTMTSALATGLTALELHTPLGSNAGRITIKNNTLCFPLATYNLAIDIATGNQPQVDIIGNHFIAPAGWYHAPSGFALENAIWFYEPDTQIGRCNIGENYINGKRFSLNLVDNDTSIVSTLYTYGRPLIKCTPAAPRDITEIDGNLGSIVTIVAGNGDVTIKNGTYLQTHTGADVNLVTGEKYQLVIYDYADNPPGVATHYYAKALIPIARYAAAAPVAGIYNLGDIVYNSSPAPGGSVGWICTTAGGPGVMVWKEFGLISL
jgi:hypothetical protein